MRIAVIEPSIYMSEITYPNRIFAPRTVILSLVEGLVGKGHDVTLFSAPDIDTKAKLVGGAPELLKGDLLRDKYLSREAIFEYRMQSSIESQHLYALDIIGKAFQMAINSDFDIIQSDDPLVHSFVHLAKCPTVFTFHDPLPRKDSLDFWFLNRYKHHNFISISNAQRKGEPVLNYADNIYHGININSFTATFSKGEYFAFMSRLLVQKGPDIAIAAIKQVPGETLKITADDTHKNTNFVKEKVIPYVDGQKIQKLDFLKYDSDKNDFLSKAKALLFPISWEEPFGLVMIEAMSCGTPVIAYNRGSVAEIVKDGVTGFIIDPDDENRPGKESWIIKKQGIDGLVEAIKRIDEIDRSACRRHVEENFTVEKMVDRYEKVYKELITAQ